MAYRRGFKTEANGIAEEIRAELGLDDLSRLDPRLLAEHLSIPVLELSEMARDHGILDHLLNVEPEAFSAVTVFSGASRTVVHNDGHVSGRQNSNLAHELSHGLLLHPPTPAMDNTGCRHWNKDIEDEANWLAGVLLVSEAATLEVAKGRWTRGEACDRFGVSRQMLQFRINSTGAVKRVNRLRSRSQ